MNGQRAPRDGWEYRGVGPVPKNRYWAYSQEKMSEFVREPAYCLRLDGDAALQALSGRNAGRSLQDLWTDIPPINSQAKERLGYPTQKPLKLMERIITREQQSRRHGTRSVLRVCHDVRSGRNARTRVGGNRLVTAGGYAGRKTAPRTSRRLRPNHRPDRHPAPDRSGQASALPDA